MQPIARRLMNYMENLADMNEKEKEQMKNQVNHYAGLSLMGFISAEANRPKGMNFDAVADASVEMGIAMVLKLHSKPVQVMLNKRLADL